MVYHNNVLLCNKSNNHFKDIQDKSRISAKFGTEIPRTTLSRNPENLRDEVFHSPPTFSPNLDNCSKFTDFRLVITEK